MPPALGPEAVCAPGKPSLPLEQSECEQRFVCTNLIDRLFLDAHPAPCRWLGVRRTSSLPRIATSAQRPYTAQRPNKTAQRPFRTGLTPMQPHRGLTPKLLTFMLLAALALSAAVSQPHMALAATAKPPRPGFPWASDAGRTGRVDPWNPNASAYLPSCGTGMCNAQGLCRAGIVIHACHGEAASAEGTAGVDAGASVLTQAPECCSTGSCDGHRGDV